MLKERQDLLKVDPVLKEIITTIPFPEIESTENVFHDLISCVLEQQIHYRSTKKIFQKMLEKANITILTPSNFSQFEKKGLEDIKLSVRKYETLMNIVQYWELNDVKWSELLDYEIRNKLLQIKGVGNWSIDMILIYTLNRPNVFSLDDFHMKQIMTRLYGLNPNSNLKSKMKQISMSWSPFMSTAFLYLLEWKKFYKSTNKKS